jgi:hypothetical protein
VLRAGRRFIRRLLFGQIRLKRQGGSLRLTLADNPGEPAPASPSAPTAPPAVPDDASVAGQCAQLKRVLDADQRSRKVFRQLHLVELTLIKDGEVGLRHLPEPVISSALMQLESLVSDWSSASLMALRTRLVSEKLAAADAKAHWKASEVHPSDFNVASRMQVLEASESEFLRAEATLTGVSPAPRPPSARAAGPGIRRA